MPISPSPSFSLPFYRRLSAAASTRDVFIVDRGIVTSRLKIFYERKLADLARAKRTKNTICQFAASYGHPSFLKLLIKGYWSDNQRLKIRRNLRVIRHTREKKSNKSLETFVINQNCIYYWRHRQSAVSSYVHLSFFFLNIKSIFGMLLESSGEWELADVDRVTRKAISNNNGYQAIPDSMVRLATRFFLPVASLIRPSIYLSAVIIHRDGKLSVLRGVIR